MVDLRVDDHAAPVPELARLLDLHRLYFGTPDPATLLALDGELADEVAQRLAAARLRVAGRLGRRRELRGAHGPRTASTRSCSSTCAPRPAADRCPSSRSTPAPPASPRWSSARTARSCARGYEEFPQHFPQPGWVEHEPEEIWQATLSACRQALPQRRRRSRTAVGITNQRETAVLWDREPSPRRDARSSGRTGVRPASATGCARPATRTAVRELTGLRFDPYFTGTKLTWLAENDPTSWAGVIDGDVVVGTVDSYLVARLTGGAAARHRRVATPSRTLLFDIAAGAWSDELCELFGVPPRRAARGRPVVRRGRPHRSRPRSSASTCRSPGIAGDQQAALFGQALLRRGRLEVHLRHRLVRARQHRRRRSVRSDAGLLTTVAWMAPRRRR